MNIHVDTLEYANDLQKAGIERLHAEAIAKLQARTVTDLIEHELVTRDHLKSELVQLETRMDGKLGQLETRMRDEIRNESTNLRRQMDGLMLQIRALQMGGTIAAFALGAVVMLSRLIR